MVSVIICSIDAGKFQKVRANYENLYRGRPLEIIGIHDARSLAEGYNRGIDQSTGSVLILSHDDIEILTPDCAARIDAHLEPHDLIGIAGTTRLASGRWAEAGDPFVYALVTSPLPNKPGYGTMLLGGGPLIKNRMHALDGVFLAMRREVAARIRFDEAVFDHFHLYDLDFTFRAYKAGFRLAVCRDLVLIHQSTGTYDDTWRKYKLRFEAVHRAQLAPYGSPQEGMRAAFQSLNRETIMQRCDPAQLKRIVEQIGAANRSLHAEPGPHLH